MQKDLWEYGWSRLYLSLKSALCLCSGKRNSHVLTSRFCPEPSLLFQSEFTHPAPGPVFSSSLCFPKSCHLYPKARGQYRGRGQKRTFAFSSLRLRFSVSLQDKHVNTEAEWQCLTSLPIGVTAISIPYHYYFSYVGIIVRVTTTSEL